MHEMHIASAIAEAAIANAGGAKIRRISIDVGDAFGHSAESLARAVGLALEARGAAGVSIETNRIRSKARCVCGDEREIGRPFEPCPDCGSLAREITAGKDCALRTVEVKEA